MNGTAKIAGAQDKSNLRIPGFAQLQRLGKSLMLPIAVLPAAGILLRLGQDDLLGRIKAPVIGPFVHAMSAAGDAIFTNLPLLFAVGVAIGFARKADGSTALAAVVGYLEWGTRLAVINSADGWPSAPNRAKPGSSRSAESGPPAGGFQAPLRGCHAR